MSSNNMTYNFEKNNPSYIKISNDIMNGYIAKQDFDEEIYILKSNLELKEDKTFDSQSNIDGMVLGYNLNGCSSHKSKNTNYNFDLASNESSMLIIKDENTTSYAPKGPLSKINLIIKKNYFERNITDNRIKDLVLSSLEKDSCENLISQRKIDSFINFILQDIYKLSL